MTRPMAAFPLPSLSQSASALPAPVTPYPFAPNGPALHLALALPTPLQEKVLKAVASYAQAALGRYPSTLEQDLQELADPGTPW